MQIDVDAGSNPVEAAPPTQPTQPTKPSKKRGSGTKGSDNADAVADKDPTGTDKQLGDFYAQVDAIKVRGAQEHKGDTTHTQSMLATIRDKQHAIEAHHERSTFVTRTEEVKAAKVWRLSISHALSVQHAAQAAMQEDINEVQRLAHAAKAKLEALDKANARAAHQPVRALPECCPWPPPATAHHDTDPTQGCGPGSSSERTRSTITAALRKRLRDGVEEFAGLRGRLQAEYREVVERRVFTVTGKAATEDEIERLIESGDAETIFQKAMLEQGRGYVRGGCAVTWPPTSVLGTGAGHVGGDSGAT